MTQRLRARRYPANAVGIVHFATVAWAGLLLLGSGAWPCPAAAQGIARQRGSQPKARPAAKQADFFVIGIEPDQEPSKRTSALVALGDDAKTWKLLVPNVQPNGRISPDGTKYAWYYLNRDRTGSALWIADLRGRAGPLIIPVEGRFGRCFWSRDGRELVVTAYDTLQSDRKSWRVSADGKRSRKLPLPATELVHDWSRDGLWLVTSSARLKPGETTRRPLAREELYVMHLDGTAERPIGPTLAKAEVRKGTTLTVLPQFSPDGRSLLWGEADLEPDEGKGTRTTHSRLMLQSLAGGTPRRLLQYEDRLGYMTSQCWSPDGRLIALHFAGNSIAASEGRIEVVDLEGNTVRTIGLQAFPDSTQRSIHNLITWR